MKNLWTAGLMSILLAQAASSQGVIRLKTGSISPAPAHGLARRETAPGAVLHFLVLFNSYPDADIRASLARRRIRVLAYVPDNTLMVSGRAPLDLAGLNVAWMGQLDPQAKISPILATQSTGAYLVVFQPDSDLGEDREFVQDQSFTIIENPDLLPAQLLVAGPASGLPNLAASDDVAYILPASVDLQSGTPVAGCPGPLTEAGVVAEYAQPVATWNSASGAGITLGYFFDQLTEKLDINAAAGLRLRGRGEADIGVAGPFGKGAGDFALHLARIQFFGELVEEIAECDAAAGCRIPGGDRLRVVRHRAGFGQRARTASHRSAGLEVDRSRQDVGYIVGSCQVGKPAGRAGDKQLSGQKVGVFDDCKALILNKFAVLPEIRIGLKHHQVCPGGLGGENGADLRLGIELSHPGHIEARQIQRGPAGHHESVVGDVGQDADAASGERSADIGVRVGIKQHQKVEDRPGSGLPTRQTVSRRGADAACFQSDDTLRTGGLRQQDRHQASGPEVFHCVSDDSLRVI